MNKPKKVEPKITKLDWFSFTFVKRKKLYSSYWWTAILKILGVFFQGTTRFFGYFFSIFYLYTLCTFYYLCKLCLYDLFSSVFLDVNELAFMLYLLFFWYVAYFGLWSEPAVWVLSSCKVYIGIVIVLCWCYCFCNT